LIADPKRTPFNIGRAIALEGFSLEEVMPLGEGFAHLPVYPQAILGAVLHWTGGQPFLTQKLCRLIVQRGQEIPAAKVAAYVAELVKTDVIDNWLQQDSPEHLKTIQDRILNSSQNQQLLNLYEQLLQYREVAISGTPEQIQLRLSGLVIEQDRRLQVANRIYGAVFTPWWIEQQKINVCPYGERLEHWLESRDDAWLMRGADLEMAKEWSKERTLPREHHQFLMESQEQGHEISIARQAQEQQQLQAQLVERQDQMADRKLAQAKQLFYLSLLLFGLSGVMLVGAIAVVSQRGDPPSGQR
jgi:hypothetical protein